MEITKQTEVEAHFDIKDLFISSTDKKGIISFGNAVFIKISGYTEHELLGSPHNIIRHSDMPKSVFKLLWDTIKQDHPISAYVKNKAKNGSYYWVLATVFPTEKGYLSIRLKPTSDVLEKVKSVYREMLELEKKRGVSEATQFLLTGLQSMGFKDYAEFSTMALFTEMESRRERMESQLQSYKSFQNTKQGEKLIHQVATVIEQALAIMMKSGSFIRFLADSGSGVHVHAARLSENSIGIESTITNMSIVAHRIGREGAALAVVANHLQSNLLELKDHLDKILNNTKELDGMRVEILFNACASKLQTEMLMQLLQELQEGKKEAVRALTPLLALLKSLEELFQSTSLALKLFLDKVCQTRNLAENLSDRIVKLNLIYSGGNLESARTSELVDLFRPYFKSLQSVELKLQPDASQLNLKLTTLLEFTEDLHRNSMKVEYLLQEGTKIVGYLSQLSLEQEAG